MTLHRSTCIPAPEFSHRETQEPVPPQGTLDRLLLRTEQTGWSVVYVRRLAPGSKQSQSTHVLHICRRLAASWDKLGGWSAEPRGTGPARHHRLGKTGGMRRQGRLGGSSPGRATAMGQRVRILTGKGLCFPQTTHLALAKMPD